MTIEGPLTQAEVAELTALVNDVGDCFVIRRTNPWQADYRTIFYYPYYSSDDIPGLRRQVEKCIARKVPELRAQLKAAEAAAERLRIAQQHQAGPGSGLAM